MDEIGPADEWRTIVVAGWTMDDAPKSVNTAPWCVSWYRSLILFVSERWHFHLTQALRNRRVQRATYYACHFLIVSQLKYINII